MYEFLGSWVFVVHAAKEVGSGGENMYLWVQVDLMQAKSINKSLAGSGRSRANACGNGVLQSSEGTFINVCGFACVKGFGKKSCSYGVYLGSQCNGEALKGVDCGHYLLHPVGGGGVRDFWRSTVNFVLQYCFVFFLEGYDVVGSR